MIVCLLVQFSSPPEESRHGQDFERLLEGWSGGSNAGIAGGQCPSSIRPQFVRQLKDSVRRHQDTCHYYFTTEQESHPLGEIELGRNSQVTQELDQLGIIPLQPLQNPTTAGGQGSFKGSRSSRRRTIVIFVC